MSQGCQYLNIERAPIEMQATDEDWAGMGRRGGHPMDESHEYGD